MFLLLFVSGFGNKLSTKDVEIFQLIIFYFSCNKRFWGTLNQMNLEENSNYFSVLL